MYKLCKNINGEITMVLRLSDNAYIPINTANIDYLHYLDWLNEGNEPLPPDEPLSPLQQ